MNKSDEHITFSPRELGIIATALNILQDQMLQNGDNLYGPISYDHVAALKKEVLEALPTDAKDFYVY